jgi:hypothetical protein
MNIYRTQLTMDGPHLALDMPPEFLAGRSRIEVDVTIKDVSVPTEVETPPDLYQYSDDRIKAIVEAARARRPSYEAPLSDEFFEWLSGLPSTGRTRAEIDAQIEEERNSWGDD